MVLQPPSGNLAMLQPMTSSGEAFFCVMHIRAYCMLEVVCGPACNGDVCINLKWFRVTICGVSQKWHYASLVALLPYSNHTCCPRAWLKWYLRHSCTLCCESHLSCLLSCSHAPWYFSVLALSAVINISHSCRMDTKKWTSQISGIW